MYLYVVDFFFACARVQTNQRMDNNWTNEQMNRMNPWLNVACKAMHRCLLPVQTCTYFCLCVFQYFFSMFGVLLVLLLFLQHVCAFHATYDSIFANDIQSSNWILEMTKVTLKCFASIKLLSSNSMHFYVKKFIPFTWTLKILCSEPGTLTRHTACNLIHPNELHLYEQIL